MNKTSMSSISVLQAQKIFDSVLTIDEKGQVLLFGRGTLDDKLYLFAEHDVKETISLISAYFEKMFEDEGVLERLADLSRGDRTGKLCYNNRGIPINEQANELKNSARFLLKSYRRWKSFLASVQKDNTAK